MKCDPLAATGFDADLGVLVAIMLALVVVGAIVLVAGRNHRDHSGPTALAILAALVVSASILGPGTPASAASAECVASGNTLQISQTTTIDGLAPGIRPAPITGLILNNGSGSTRIDAVSVQITSVSLSPDAPGGPCDASDYVVIDPLMHVDRVIEARASASFTGASIGFVTKSTNQDACIRAVVHLLYTVNPQN